MLTRFLGVWLSRGSDSWINGLSLCKLLTASLLAMERVVNSMLWELHKLHRARNQVSTSNINPPQLNSCVPKDLCISKAPTSQGNARKISDGLLPLPPIS